jgi:uncharacterized membrane protein YtjA (UPF0391 family)
MHVLQPFARPGVVFERRGGQNKTPFISGPESGMLYGALILAAAALVAGVLGFGGLASAAATLARILFFIFLVMFLVTLIAALL